MGKTDNQTERLCDKVLSVINHLPPDYRINLSGEIRDALGAYVNTLPIDMTDPKATEALWAAMQIRAGLPWPGLKEAPTAINAFAMDSRGRCYDAHGQFIGAYGRKVKPTLHPTDGIIARFWDRVFAEKKTADEPMVAQAADEMEIDAGALESFLAIMTMETGNGALETMAALAKMASSLKRLDAPRYSIIKGDIRLDIENGKIRFVGSPKDRRSYADLKSEEKAGE